jgi:hypothetical protein
MPRADYHKPPLQKQIVRILAIVPIYAICSFLTLLACAGRHQPPQRCFGTTATPEPEPEPEPSSAYHNLGSEPVPQVSADTMTGNCYDGSIGYRECRHSTAHRGAVPCCSCSLRPIYARSEPGAIDRARNLRGIHAILIFHVPAASVG